jgi:hypothetical protein
VGAEGLAGNVPATFRELSNIAGIPFRAGEASIKKLLGRGLLADGENGGLVIPKWHQRQFSSDNSTSRTRKYKEKIKGDGTVRERSRNVPGTDQNTDNRIQIKDIEKRKRCRQPRKNKPSEL